MKIKLITLRIICMTFFGSFQFIPVLGTAVQFDYDDFAENCFNEKNLESLSPIKSHQFRAQSLFSIDARHLGVDLFRCYN